MKKLLPCFLFALVLSGCGDTPKPVKPADMDKGYIHFAANLALEDIARHGEASPYSQLIPSRVPGLDTMLDANNVIEDYRRDFSTAEDRYLRLQGKGTMIRGVVDHTDKDKREVVFARNEMIDKRPFTGILRLSMDKDFYYPDNMPDYTPGSVATFMCREHRPVHDFKNESIHKVELRLIECMQADDYYASLQEKMKERLLSIYGGHETVSPDLAKKLAMLYLTGQSLPADSVCLYGGFFACHDKLPEEFSRKWEDVKVEHIGAMNIDPNKLIARKFEQVDSEPAVRPDNAGISPSGQKIDQQAKGVKAQKEAVSRVKTP